MGIFYNRQRKKARVKNWGWTADGGCGIINSGFDAPVVKLADTMDLGSIPATGRGSSPLGRTSSEIPNTAPFPALRKTALCWEFLRFRAGFALLDSGPKGARGALMGECGPF